MEKTQNNQKEELLSSVKIGRVLALARKAKRLNQTELAERVGLRSSYISQIESDDRIPTLQTLEAICQILEVPTGIILLKAKIEESVKEQDRDVFDKLLGALNALYFEKSRQKVETLEPQF